MIDLAMTILKAFAVTGMVMVLSQHVQLQWWEGGALSFGIMVLFGGNNTNPRY